MGLYSGQVGAQSMFILDGGAKFVMTGSVNAVFSGGTDLKTTSSQIKMDGGTLIITGNNQGAGNISSSPASSLILSGIGGTLNFDQALGATRSIKELTLTNGATVILGNPLEITAGSNPGTVIVNSAATLTTNNNLTLKSDADRSGWAHIPDYKW